ncbi:MAG: UDP-N-acetylmuramoyl-L-alanyl-D-glutamate--2,6-diaminopimelate ligase [Oscillospiraceae bacterium]|nr:UDP-N-acetylmuramoyl-L-alanyl-D-glutamate--2,6-diaminopimelate ligase [Oscillospiraceae bacterium]
MTLEKLLENVEKVDIKADGSVDISGICYDSRDIRSGELFIAVRGYETDGHRYIEDAVKKGAACIICEEAPEIPTSYIIVKDSRKALAAVSAVWFGHPSEKLIIIGVTGTNGKTSVTNLIKHIIEKNTSAKVGLVGTNGNFIGERELSTGHTTPESYELHKLLDKMVLEDCTYVVMEVSSHALYQSRVHGIQFDIGVFTNLTPEHLDFHGTMEEYARAKTLLFPSCNKSVVNIDDVYAPLMIEKSAGPVISYAIENSSADLVGKDIKLQADKIDFCAVSMGSINRVELQIPGLFSVYNALASIATATLLGFSIDVITPALRSYEGVKGRAEVIPTGHDFTVLIDYAHTPDALKNIITAVCGFAKGRVITVFGCGGDRDKTKRPLMGQIATELSDYTVITSDNPRTEDPGSIINDITEGIKNTKAAYKVIENRHDAICWAIDSLNNGDVLIIAGKGHETYQILGKEKIHFDDREIVAQHIRQIRANSRKQKVEDLD